MDEVLKNMCLNYIKYENEDILISNLFLYLILKKEDNLTSKKEDALIDALKQYLESD